MQDASSERAMTQTALAPARQAAFVFILVTVLLDMLALGMIMPILPRLVVISSAATMAGRPTSMACSARSGR